MSILISDHSFMKRLGRLYSLLVEEAVDFGSMPEDIHFIRPPRQHEMYMDRVLRAARELEAVCYQLDQTVCFLSNFRSTQKLKEHGITRRDHIRLHLDNHLIRMVSSLDRALILTNEVFGLGNDPRECKRQVITRNQYIVDTPVAKVLNEMNAYVSPKREERNIAIHRARSTHDGFFEGLEMRYGDWHVDPSYVPLPVLKKEADRFVACRKEELVSANEGLFDIVDRLFSRLEEAFEIRYSLVEAAGRYALEAPDVGERLPLR